MAENVNPALVAALRQVLGEFEFSSGSGLLDARALWASIVGPQRLAMAQGRSVTMSPDMSVEISKNLAASNAYTLVGVALPAGSAVATLGVVMSNGSTLGTSTSSPYTLIPTMGGTPFAPTGFMQLLMPGEQLYGQIYDAAFPAGGGATQRVVVSAVQF